MSEARPVSFRNRLLWSLSLATGAALLIAALAIDLLVDHTLERHLAEALEGQHAAIRSGLSLGPDGRLDPRSNQLSGLHIWSDTPQFQLWDRFGKVILRSEALNGRDLVTGYSVPDALQSAREIRTENIDGVSRMVLIESFELSPKGGEAQTPVKLTLAVARKRDDIERLAKQLDQTLIGIIITVLGTVALVARRQIGLLLGPVESLAQQAQSLSPHEPDQRLDMKHLPSELQPVVARLNEALDRVQMRLEREQALSRDMAHELRTPISEMLTMLQINARFPEQLSASEVNAELQTLLRRMAATIDTLMNLTRLQAGLEQVKFEVFDLPLWLETVLPRTASERARIDVVMNRTTFEGDPGRSAVLVRGLLDNALRHSPEDSRIVMTFAPNEQPQAFLALANTANKLRPQDLAPMQRRYWRGADSAGNGLGLDLANALADAIGMRLKLRLVGEPPQQILELSVLWDREPAVSEAWS